jgi:hypothetical protein
VKLNVWLKAAITTALVIAVISRIPQVRKIVFNEGPA